jgi:tetratricopeptide (TPR) repeat protein
MSQQEENLCEDYALRAAQYYENEDFVRAEQQARRGLALDSDHGILNLILGRTLLKKRNLSSVAASRGPLEKAHQAIDNHRTTYSLGEFHLRYGEFLRGEAGILRSTSDGLPPEENFEQADLYRRAKRLEDKASEHLGSALGFMNQALADQPDWIYALQHKASILAHQKKHKKALATIDHLCVILAKSRKHKNERLVLQELSVAEENRLRRDLFTDIEWELAGRGLASTILMNLKSWELADAHLTKMLSLAPNMVTEYYNRGLCRHYMGRVQEAAADMKTFVGRTNLAMSTAEVDRALTIMAKVRL